MIVTALLGGGGLGALLRARGQNRTDAAAQLTTEQVQFRQHMSAEISRLDAERAASDKRADELAALVLSSSKEIAALQQQNKDQATEISYLRKQNSDQSTQIALQQAQLEQAIDEKAKAQHQAQVEHLTKEFLERENNALRTEVQRLKALLPPRIEVPNGSVLSSTDSSDSDGSGGGVSEQAP